MEIKLIGAGWCQPCKAVKSYLEQNYIEYEYLDIDEEETLELTATYGIRSVPAIIKVGYDKEYIYVGSNMDQIKAFLGGDIDS